MIENTNNSRILAELIDQIGRFASGEGFVSGLTESQWSALRYFSKANRFSRTVSAYAEFHATTRGTASQTIKTLVDQGYLTRTRSEVDGRSTRIDLTSKSQAVLADDPFELLIRATDALEHEDREQMIRTLEQMREHLTNACCKPSFGMCSACNYLECRHDKDKQEPTYRCCLLGQELEPHELEQICVYQEPQRATSTKSRDEDLN